MMGNARTYRSRTSRGFTLVETLCAIIVLTLVTLMVVTGVQMAMSVSKSSSFTSRSAVLSDTIDASVGESVHYAGSIVSTSSTTAVEYRGYVILDPLLQIADDDGDGYGRLHIVGTDEKGANVDIDLLNSGTYGDLEIGYVTDAALDDGQRMRLLTEALQTGNLAYTVRSTTDPTDVKRFPETGAKTFRSFTN